MPDGRQGAGERRLDGAVVAYGRAGHIEAGQREGADHAATPGRTQGVGGDGRRARHAAPARTGHQPHARVDLLA